MTSEEGSTNGGTPVEPETEQPPAADARTAEDSAEAHEPASSGPVDSAEDRESGGVDDAESDVHRADDAPTIGDVETSYESTAEGHRVTRRTVHRRITVEDVDEEVVERLPLAAYQGPSASDHPAPVG